MLNVNLAEYPEFLKICNISQNRECNLDLFESVIQNMHTVWLLLWVKINKV